MDILIQAIGYIGVLLFIFSYQIKSNRALFLSDIGQRAVLPAIFPVKCLERLSEPDGHHVSKRLVDVV